MLAVSDELMLTYAGGLIKEDVVLFNLGGTDKLRLGSTSQYQQKQNLNFKFVPAVLYYIYILSWSSSSVYLSYLILVVPVRECLGKQLCMSITFSIERPNGTKQ